MGRQRWTNRLTVEDCPIFLNVRQFQRDGIFSHALGTPFTMTWTIRETASSLGILDYRVTHDGPTGLAIRIPPQLIRIQGSFTLSEGQLIPVASVRPHLGGVRPWFRCECGKRAGRLYLPFRQPIFRCRQCYNLTYQSAQEHDKRLGSPRNDDFAEADPTRTPKLTAGSPADPAKLGS
jgi:hypothetical protein